MEETEALAGECQGVSDSIGQVLVSLVDSHFASQKISDFFRRYHDIKTRWKEEDLTVGVLALAKSGKSTLINALCGAQVVPCNNVPETARICSIKHAPHLDLSTATLTYQPGGDAAPVRVEGAGEIREAIRDLNRHVREQRFSSLQQEELLSIEVPITALSDVDRLGGPGVRLLDTPGPNEYGQDALRYRVERLLEGVDAVVYVLDYTKLKTREEGDVLQRLREINPALVQRLCRRLFFVVNKCDMMDSCEGLGEEETRQYVAELITQQVGGDAGGWSLLPEQVFLLSARDALLARLVLFGRAGEEDRAQFMRKAFGKRWTRVADEGEVREVAAETLKESGLLDLEACVVGYLASRGAVLRLVAALDDMERLVAQIANLATTAAGTLRADVATLQEQVAEMQGRLDAMLDKFESVQAEVAELEGHVVDEVRARLDGLKRKLERDIDCALDPAQACRVPRGRWPAIWSKAKRFLGISAAAEGVPTPEEVQMRLAELHSDLYLQIEAEVKDFWHGLESATNAKQKQLFAAINNRLASLATAMEQEVAAGLDLPPLSLQPVDMRIRPPTAEQFHASLQDLFASGIRTRRRTETQMRREQVTVFVKERGGLCNSFEFYVPRTEEAVVTEEVQVTTYVADPAKIKDYFVGVVGRSTDNSARHVKAYVHRYLADQLAAAREQLQSYAAAFSLAMADALDVVRQGEEERAAALARVEEHYRQASQLLGRIHSLQAVAECALGPTEADAGEALGRLAASFCSLGADSPAQQPGSGSPASVTRSGSAPTAAALAQLSAAAANLAGAFDAAAAQGEGTAEAGWSAWHSMHSAISAGREAGREGGDSQLPHATASSSSRPSSTSGGGGSQLFSSLHNSFQAGAAQRSGLALAAELAEAYTAQQAQQAPPPAGPPSPKGLSLLLVDQPTGAWSGEEAGEEAGQVQHVQHAQHAQQGQQGQQGQQWEQEGQSFWAAAPPFQPQSSHGSADGLLAGSDLLLEAESSPLASASPASLAEVPLVQEDSCSEASGLRGGDMEQAQQAYGSRSGSRAEAGVGGLLSSASEEWTVVEEGEGAVPMPAT